MEHSNFLSANDSPVTRQIVSGPNGETESVASPRILLAEDSQVSMMLALHQLQKLANEIDTVKHGGEAVEAWKAKRHDIILMDCEMPVMDGCQAASEIRRIEGPQRRTLIFAVTAHAIEEEREKCIAAGMDDLLAKPFRSEQLAAIVHVVSSDAARRWKLPVVLPAAIAVLREEKPGGDLLRTMAEIWREDWPVILDEMEVAGRALDGEALANLAHKLKGGAANFGSAPVQQRCRAIEELCHEKLIGFAASMLPLLRGEAAEVQAALEREIASNP